MSHLNQETISALKELDDDGSNDTLKALISLYCENSPVKVKMIADSFKSGDFTTMKKEAHTLKSSSGNLGAMKLLELANKIEYMVEDQNYTKNLAPLIQELQAEYLAVEAELKTFLNCPT